MRKLTKNKALRTWLHDPIFRADFLVQRGGDPYSAVVAFCRHCKELTPADFCCTKTDIDEIEKNGVYGRCYLHAHIKGGVMWLNRNSGAGAIAHEVRHMVDHCLICFHFIENTWSCTELFAYYTEWMTREIVNRLY